MKVYNFRKVVLHDKTVLFFFLFFLINSFSYSAEVLFKTTLVGVRIAFMVLLLIQLLTQTRRSKTNFKNGNRLLILFILFYTCSLVANIITADVLFYLSLVITLLVCSLFVNYLDTHYKLYKSNILIDIFFYSLLYVPLILVLHPGYISLNLYSSNTIETIGLKSRYLGWACTILFTILLYQLKIEGKAWWKMLFMLLLFFFVVISGSRSSLLGLLVSVVLFFLNQKNKLIYLLSMFFFLFFFFLAFNKPILNYLQQVSFYERVEAKQGDVLAESYRKEVFVDAINMSIASPLNFIFGFGPGLFNETLDSFYPKYRNNELSSHNTYLEVFITGGVFSFIIFLQLYVIKPFLSFYKRNRELSYILAPVIIISITENNFGIGQYLFLIFTLLALHSYKI